MDRICTESVGSTNVGLPRGLVDFNIVLSAPLELLQTTTAHFRRLSTLTCFINDLLSASAASGSLAPVAALQPANPCKARAGLVCVAAFADLACCFECTG